MARLRASAWWIVGAAIVAVSVLVVVLAGTRPGYDPYGWLVWGHQALHGTLDLGGAPSWKPLPLLFTVPYGLLGGFALWLWMVTAVAVSLAASVFAGRVAWRLVSAESGSGPGARWPRIAAALFAGLAIYGIEDDIFGAHSSYLHYLLSVQSDPMIVTLVLAAIDTHLQGRRRWTLALLGLASLGRPEAWPALALYGAWCWWRLPALRAMCAAEAAFVAFMWFGIPAITNGRPLIAGDLAERSPRALHDGKVLGTLERFAQLNLWPVWVLAGVAVVGAALALGDFHALRKDRSQPRDADRVVLGLAALVVVWLIVEVAFALHGFPGVPRYMFEPAAVAVLLAGVGVGRLLAIGLGAAAGSGRAVPRAAAWSAPAAAVVLCALLIPGARDRIAVEHRDVRHERLRTQEIDRMADTVRALGGRAAVLRCGQPVTNVEYVSLLGWLMGLNDGVIGHRPQFELHRHVPVVLFTALPNGWAAYGWHLRRSTAAACARQVDRVHVVTAAHPGGVTVANHVPPRPDPPIPNATLPG